MWGQSSPTLTHTQATFRMPPLLRLNWSAIPFQNIPLSNSRHYSVYCLCDKTWSAFRNLDQQQQTLPTTKMKV